jgi:tRNA A-37 threonylcarbamoyl transferase component Bud32
MTGGDGGQDSLKDAIRQAGLDSLEGAFAYAGGEDLVKDGLGHRRRTRVVLVDSAGSPIELYLKRYQREPPAWRLRRLLTYGPRRSPASVEFGNIAAARRAGIPTMRGLAFGQAFRGTDAGRSYILVTAVPGSALARCAGSFLAAHAADGTARELAVKLGELAGRLHAAGLVHRDFYSTHIFLSDRGGQFDLHLIDLARMFRPRWRPFRWRARDLAQLKFSMPAAWAQRHWGDVLSEYCRRTGLAGAAATRMAAAVDRKAAAILRRHLRKARRQGATGP